MKNSLHFQLISEFPIITNVTLYKIYMGHVKVPSLGTEKDSDLFSRSTRKLSSHSPPLSRKGEREECVERIPTY